MGHLMLTIGYLKATVVHIRLFFSISKHKANTTELHPKVRQTCCLQFGVSIFKKSKSKLWNHIATLSDTVVGSVLGHVAHGVGIAGGGELAHRSPLVSLRIIEQHFSQPVAISTSCNDESLIVWTVDDWYPHQTQGSVHQEVKLL